MVTQPQTWRDLKTMRGVCVCVLLKGFLYQLLSCVVKKKGGGEMVGKDRTRVWSRVD